METRIGMVFWSKRRLQRKEQTKKQRALLCVWQAPSLRFLLPACLGSTGSPQFRAIRPESPQSERPQPFASSPNRSKCKGCPFDMWGCDVELYRWKGFRLLRVEMPLVKHSYKPARWHAVAGFGPVKCEYVSQQIKKQKNIKKKTSLRNNGTQHRRPSW